MLFVAKQYKKDVISRLGGPLQYQKLIIELTERLVRDPKLKPSFGSLDYNGVHKVLKDMLDLALCDLDMESREKLHAKVVLYHYGLFLLGLNATNFTDIKNHLIGALLHSWVDADVIDDILSLFEELRKEVFDADIGLTDVFKEKDKGIFRNMLWHACHL